MGLGKLVRKSVKMGNKAMDNVEKVGNKVKKVSNNADNLIKNRVIPLEKRVVKFAKDDGQKALKQGAVVARKVDNSLMKVNDAIQVAAPMAALALAPVPGASAAIMGGAKGIDGAIGRDGAVHNGRKAAISFGRDSVRNGREIAQVLR